jgi:general nucleoside transport system ATP-binding protein
VLILDEPTAVLTPQESESLFDTVRLLTEEGRAVIFVSHKLEEVTRVSDRITVLRDGRRVATIATSEAEASDLARMMVGREVAFPERRGPARLGDVVLSVRGLAVTGDRGIGVVHGVDLQVRAGEILGVAGVSGNGQRELAEAIAGLRDIDAGAVELGSVDVTGWSPRRRTRAGLGYIPENRLGTGLAPGLSIVDNLSLRRYRRPPMSGRLILRRAEMERHADELVRAFDVRGVRARLPVRLLSGGNLQKALLAREIDQQPLVLIASGPTRGLDVGATVEVRRRLLDERDRGAGILLISEDLEELRALADRIAVIHRGAIVGEVDATAASVEEIGLLMAGSR